MTESEAELVAGWILDWLLTYEDSNPGLGPSPRELIEATHNEELTDLVERHATVALGMSVSAGLLKSYETLGESGMDLCVSLTDSGRREAVSRLERRRNHKRRRAAARDAVLQWVYEAEASGQATSLQQILTTPYGWFSGVPYEVSDLVEAAAFLREAQLLVGSDETLRLTVEGTRCIERYGDVVTYLNRADFGGGIAVVVQGDNNGQLAVANRDVQQSQKQSLDPKVLQVFAQALREFAELVPDQAEEYREVATALDREAEKDSPDRGWVSSLLDRARGLLAKANHVQGVAQLASLGLQLFGLTQGIGS